MSSSCSPHPHATDGLNASFKWAVALNASYVLLEAGAGFVTGSLSLLADAAHNLTDVAGLLMAWGAMAAASRPANKSHTYGYGRATILAALTNAIVILIGVGAVLWEAIQRFSQPTEIPAGIVMGVASLGIAINAGTALLFHAERHNDLNARGAFLHMMTDAAVSLGVVLGGGIILFTGWTWIDPVVAIAVSILVAATTYDLFKSSFHLTLDGVPPSVDQEAVQKWLTEQEGVTAVHDLHIWALSTTTTALTAHLIMPSGCPDDGFLPSIAEELKEHFNIHHTTLQVGQNKAHCCSACCTSDQSEKRENK